MYPERAMCKAVEMKLKDAVETSKNYRCQEYETFTRKRASRDRLGDRPHGLQHYRNGSCPNALELTSHHELS